MILTGTEDVAAVSPAVISKMPKVKEVGAFGGKQE
ncbi:hypothetical protein SDC9_17191 [bioreactor metagenome]|uniref:Uncharacterized protein n=1 Tax=bioreactor metagenome TaxID=1076179 RepID=A0A644TWQ3_9ZZZZ